MQGLYVHGARPKSKKAIREELAANGTANIRVEATSFFGNEYEGRLDDAPIGTKVEFVGPNPHTDRRFYGRLIVTDKGVKLA